MMKTKRWLRNDLWAKEHIQEYKSCEIHFIFYTDQKMAYLALEKTFCHKLSRD